MTREQRKCEETDLQEEIKNVYRARSSEAVASLNRRRIHAEYVPDRKAALSKVLDMIPEEATVGWGDSVTLHQIGIIPILRERKGSKLVDPISRDADGYMITTGAELAELFRKALVADVFLTGTNAITLDGKLVNIDALGNRVAAMIFGPKKVIVVAGVNKIVRDLDEAIRRIKDFAAPVNVQRHYLKHHLDAVVETPCFKTGICADCDVQAKACNFTVIIEGENAGPMGGDYLPRIHVVIVGEQLGI